MYYVVQVATGKEQKAIDDINKALSDKSKVDVFSPYRKVLRKYKGEYRELLERCFPGYLFVETDDPKQLFFDLYEVPDYTRLLGREGLNYYWEPLNKVEARMVDILYGKENERTTSISDIEIEEGDHIRVLSGPLMDLKGYVKAVDLHKRKITLTVTMFKRPMDVQVGVNIVTRLPD